MNIRKLVFAAAVLLCTCGLASPLWAANIGTAFTYQGLLADNGTPADGLYDFEFAILDGNGMLVQTITDLGVAVAGGLINTTLDLGSESYTGRALAIEVHVRPGGSADPYTVLQPAQTLTPAPLASGLVMPFSRDVSPVGVNAFRINSLTDAIAIEGDIPAGSGHAAIYGVAPDGAGVEGASTSGYGVIGLSTNGTGVLGTTATNTGLGVNGEATGGGTGVRGVSDTADAIRGVSISGIGVHGFTTTVQGVYGLSVSGSGVQGDSTNFTGVTGVSGSAFGVFAFGNLGATGAKTFVEPDPVDASREIRYAALEGPEVGTYFRGTAQLVDGVATIDIPDTFKVVTDPQGLTVQLTAVGQNANLYCVTRSLDGIEVAGAPDVWFDYQVNGVRKAFADFQPSHANTMFVPDSPDASRLIASLPAESLARLISNGTLNADGSVNLATVHRLGWNQRPGWTDQPKVVEMSPEKK